MEKLAVEISETAYVAIDGDNGRPYKAVKRRKHGRGARITLTGTRADFLVLKEDLEDRAYHFDADPPAWKSASRVALLAVDAVLNPPLPVK